MLLLEALEGALEGAVGGEVGDAVEGGAVVVGGAVKGAVKGAVGGDPAAVSCASSVEAEKEPGWGADVGVPRLLNGLPPRLK